MAISSIPSQFSFCPSACLQCRTPVRCLAVLLHICRCFLRWRDGQHVAVPVVPGVQRGDLPVFAPVPNRFENLGCGESNLDGRAGETMRMKTSSCALCVPGVQQIKNTYLLFCLSFTFVVCVCIYHSCLVRSWGFLVTRRRKERSRHTALHRFGRSFDVRFWSRNHGGQGSVVWSASRGLLCVKLWPGRHSAAFGVFACCVQEFSGGGGVLHVQLLPFYEYAHRLQHYAQIAERFVG